MYRVPPQPAGMCGSELVAVELVLGVIDVDAEVVVLIVEEARLLALGVRDRVVGCEWIFQVLVGFQLSRISHDLSLTPKQVNANPLQR